VSKAGNFEEMADIDEYESIQSEDIYSYGSRVYKADLQWEF